MSPLHPRRRDALALLAAGALPWTAQAQERRDAVHISISLEPDSLDPTSAPAAANAEVVHYNLLEGLTKIEQNGQTRPLLAQAWDTSADQRVWRFTLRPGVRFHDGAALDAQTVRWCFLRAQQTDSGNKGKPGLFDNIAAIDTPDAQTLVLHLHHPDLHLLFRLGDSYAVILHPQSAAQASTAPVGTGPYRLEHWQHGQSIRLRRFAGYWGARPALEQGVFHFNAGQDVQALDTQRIDMFFNFASRRLDSFRSNAQYQVLVGASSGKGLLALNHRLPLFQDVRVRQALTHAIDRERFIATALHGYGSVIGSHFTPNETGYIRLAGTYPYDPERARQLLRSANVQLPVKVPLALPPTPYAQMGGPLIADDLAQVGIQVQLQPLSWPQWLDGPFKGEFGMTLINHVEPLDYGIYAKPDYYFGYDSPRYRDLLAQYQNARSARQRQLLFADIQRFLAADAANVWLFNASIGTVVRTGLQGVWVDYPTFAHDIAAMYWR